MATSMFGVIDGNREHLSRWFDWLSTTLHIEDSLQYLFDKEKETEQGKKIEYGLFVDNEYIGNISLFNIHQKNKSAEMGYWLSFSHMRNGYMTEAIQILEKEAFENCGLHRIQIKCDERNEASSGIAKKCGYTYEAKLRAHSFSEYFNDFCNTLVFSKLQSEYDNEQRK